MTENWHGQAMSKITLPQAAVTQEGLALGQVRPLSSTTKELLTYYPRLTAMMVTLTNPFVYLLIYRMECHACLIATITLNP
jgi:hypothetical protein